ncbi:hypothetical protein LARI1_G005373 [Lachnellula arida]|uniref:Uncharacterized protein n=2 Tax=Lachnellula TaxID=47830 RepID=A0A8T9BDC7_9HELO|nr:hypothetical protein LARI1_G005373 [Lachnellula arida]TVY94302.1 hypothetical protein LAWI1_G001146 [Lachnellula willkommii]
MPPMTMTPLFRTMLQRRAMSIGARARSAVRNFEPHPFERYSTTEKAQKADWVKQVKRVGNVSVIYFPWMAAALGWPLLAEKLVPNL